MRLALTCPFCRKRSALTVVYFIANVLYLRSDNFAALAFFAYFVARVHNGGVIASAEVFAYRYKRHALTQYIANKVNTYLPRYDYLLVFLFAYQFFALYAEIFAGGGNDVVYRYNIAACVGVVAQRVVDNIHIVGIAAHQRRVTYYTV